jgi:hypothetical protein
MKKASRFAIALLLLLGIFFLAQGRVAWADYLFEQDPLAQNNQARSGAIAHDDIDRRGTVKPPPPDANIRESGRYSMGGFCTLTVTFNVDGVSAMAYVEHPLLQPLPAGVHAVQQGCRVTYYESDIRIDELPSDMGSATICFAAIPEKQMMLYFYNVYAEPSTWTAADTKVENGIACAEGNRAGTYVATFKEP